MPTFVYVEFVEQKKNINLHWYKFTNTENRQYRSQGKKTPQIQDLLLYMYKKFITTYLNLTIILYLYFLRIWFVKHTRHRIERK